MKRKARFLGALAALILAAGALSALPYLVLRAQLPAEQQPALDALAQGRLDLVIFAVLAAICGIGLLFGWLWQRHVVNPLVMRDRVELMLEPHPGTRLPEDGPRELALLARAINRLADRRDVLAGDLSKRIAEATARVDEEKNRFAALLAELSQSVIVCNAGGRILLYNARARALVENGHTSGLVGLGRSIFGVIEPSLIGHGLEQIEQRMRAGEARPVAAFVTATPAGQLIRTQMAPVLKTSPDDEGRSASGIDGYVLILDDITRRVDLESQRDLLLQSLTEGARASLANIRAAVENLSEYPDMEPQQRERFIGIVRDEAQLMSRRIEQTLADFSDALKVRWPLEDMLGTDLIQAARLRIERRLGLPGKLEEIESDLWIKVDSHSLLQGISYLAARLKEEFGVREIRLRLGRSGRLAFVDVGWTGAVIGTETLLSWELEPMQNGGETSPLTLREVIERHDGELWFQRDKASHRGCFRLLVPAAEAPPQAPAPAPPAAGRPEYYDFDLFGESEVSHALDDVPLAQLAYTAFDTETTGLEPSAGDEIIQIGAVRIVNGRLLRGEVFDQLVDPQRPVSAASARIHGITCDMLAGQPSIAQVLPRFHAFCSDTVLVGHNAAFDMRFLQLKETETGVAFRQPVLDTLLLSALLHPNQATHSLEAITERFGIKIVGRHTALGDALVTGELLLKMIPLLAAQGIHTLRQAREASARTYYAKIGY